MKKKIHSPKKLSLSKETVQLLNGTALPNVVAGGNSDTEFMTTCVYETI